MYRVSGKGVGGVHHRGVVFFGLSQAAKLLRSRLQGSSFFPFWWSCSCSFLPLLPFCVVQVPPDNEDRNVCWQTQGLCETKMGEKIPPHIHHLSLPPPHHRPSRREEKKMTPRSLHSSAGAAAAAAAAAADKAMHGTPSTPRAVHEVVSQLEGSVQ